jgi:hypothetical protein
MKSFLDFVLISNTSCKSASTVLLGKLIGLYPKISDSIRPIFGSITTSIYLLSYLGDRIITTKSKEMYDSVKGFPSANDFRNKLDKLSNPRLITIRKALQIVLYLLAIEEPHWCMSPLAATSMVIGGKLAWEDDSICRLIHLILYTVRGDSIASPSHDNEIPSADNTNYIHRPNHSGEVNKLNEAEVDIKRSSKRVSQYSSNTNKKKTFIGAAAITNQANSITNPSNINILHRLHNLSIKAQEIWDTVPNTSWKEPVNFMSLGNIVYHDPVDNFLPSRTSNETGNMKSPNAAGMRGRGAIYLKTDLSSPKLTISNEQSSTNGRASFTRTESSLSQDAKSSHSKSRYHDEFVNSSYYESAKQLAKNTGKGVISAMNVDAALTMIPPDMMITPAELSLICIAAWEAEYERVIQIQSSSMIVNNRRPAIKGSFNPSQTKLTFPDKLLLKKIINWYHNIYMPEAKRNASNLQEISSKDDELSIGNDSESTVVPAYSIDWNLIKSLAEERLLPFMVPKSLYLKSPAELNYHSLQIMLEDETRRNKERLDDEIRDDESLGTLSTNPMLAGIRLRNGLKSLDNDSISDDVIEDIAAYSVGQIILPKKKVTMMFDQIEETNNGRAGVMTVSASPLGGFSSQLSPRTPHQAMQPTLLGQTKSRPSSKLRKQKISIPDGNQDLSTSNMLSSRINYAHTASRSPSRISSPRPVQSLGGTTSNAGSRVSSPQANMRSITLEKRKLSSQRAPPLLPLTARKPLSSRHAVNLADDSLSLQEQHINVNPSSTKFFHPTSQAISAAFAALSSPNGPSDDVQSIFESALTHFVPNDDSKSKKAFKRAVKDVIRTSNYVLENFEASSSVSTNPNRNLTIPGARGKMYPQGLYYSEKPGKFSIGLPDIIDNHPNLLTKANLIVGNTLIVDTKGGLKFDSPEPILSKILAHTCSSPATKISTLRERCSETKKYEEMIAKYHERLHYSSSVKGQAVNANRDIFYRTIDHNKCPPIGYDGSRRDRQNNQLSADNQPLEDGDPEQKIFLSSNLQSPSPAKDIPYPFDDDSLQTANFEKILSQTDLMSITSQQFIESFSFEFLEFIREILDKTLPRRACNANGINENNLIKHEKSMDSCMEAIITLDSFILRKVNLSDPDEFAQVISRFMNPHAPAIQKLYLEDLNFGYYGAMLLNSSNLNQSSNLSELNLSGNNLGDRGVVAILECLSIKSETKIWLTSLTLRNNAIAFANDGLRILTEFTYLT